MKKCTKCNETKELDQFYKSGKYYKSHCKPCNTKGVKEFYQRNPTSKSKHDKKYHTLGKDGHFSVYLLPDHNYVGMTHYMRNRMSQHRSDNGRNTDNVRVLYTTKSKDEALELEALLHDIGYEGKADAWATRRK